MVQIQKTQPSIPTLSHLSQGPDRITDHQGKTKKGWETISRHAGVVVANVSASGPPDTPPETKKAMISELSASKGRT